MAFENVEDAYALSPIQAGMLYDVLAAPDSDVYVTYVTVDIDGQIDVDRFKSAWQSVFLMHQALRSEFYWDGLDEPLQVVVSDVALNWSVQDWTNLDVTEQTEQTQKLIAEERLHKIDINKAPLARFSLMRLSDNKYRLLWSVHHLLADGLSTPSILQHVLERYGSQSSSAAKPIYQYSQYINWLANQNMDDAQNYWATQLKDAKPTHTRLRQALSNGNSQLTSTAIPKVNFGLTDVETKALEQYCQQNRITLSTFLHGAWALLLHVYSGGDSSLFASTVSGRQSDVQGMEDAVGLYLNAQPRWIPISAELGVGQWLQEIQSGIHSAAKYDFATLRDVQDHIQRDANENPFESIITVGGHPSELDLSSEEFEFMFTNIRYESTQSHYPLAFLAFPGKSLEMSLVYDSNRYNHVDIQGMGQYLLELINLMIVSPVKHTPKNLLKNLARQRAPSVEKNQTPEAGSTMQTVHQWFEQTADNHPDTPCLIINKTEITFAELDKRANQIASMIQSSVDSQSSKLIGVLLPRGVEQIATLLGILKAGHAYVPIDPDYPQTATRLLIETAKITHVISSEKISKDFSTESVAYLMFEDALSFSSERVKDVNTTSDSLAYVMFTSGSTGTPKGVKISHRNLIYSTATRIDYYNCESPRYLLLSSFAFDSSVAGIFWCLCGGGTLVLPSPGQEKDVASIAELIDAHRITHTLCLPSYYALLLEISTLKNLGNLEVVILAGEACPSWIIDEHFASKAQAKLFNEYGPTEACVWSSVYCFSGRSLENVPIGKAPGTTYLEVVDAEGIPRPVGTEGEIVIGGPGLSPGYLFDAESTNQRFVQNPVGSESLVYKTGDRGYRDEDGNLVFLGRVDRQLKIRGYRIEPAALETVLDAHTDIAQSVVVAMTPQQRPLSDDNVDREQLIQRLYQEFSEESLKQAITDLGFSNKL